jgi:hypothetical protein
MSRKNATKVWDLAPGQLAELDDARGMLLRVTRGALWVTMERDLRDIVLAAGDAFVVDRNGVTLLEAQGRTTVCVQPEAAGAAGYRIARPRWRTYVTAWLRRLARAVNDRRRFVPYV